MTEKFEDRLIEYDRRIRELKRRLFRDIAITILGFLIAVGSLFFTTGIVQQIAMFIGIFLMIMPVIVKLTEKK